VNLGLSLGGFGSHDGSAPSPFDALNGARLAGPQGSHPLHDVAIAELLTPAKGPLQGEIALAAPTVLVGEGIAGTISITAAREVSARSAHLRLLGLRLVEERRSREDHDARGNVIHSEHWVEVTGRLFSTEAFIDPAIPTSLAAGQAYTSPFSIPAPPLGPPTAHLGEAIVAWAVEVRFDVAWAEDTFVATLVQVDQHPDLLRAGVGAQGGASLLDTVAVDGATIAVTSPLPAQAGGRIEVAVAWPGAPSGRGARLELHRRTNAPNGIEGIVASTPVEIAALRDGSCRDWLPVPDGSAPSFDGADLEVAYVLRVLVDRAFRDDAAIERPIAIA
jgi:hypothetical protein